MCTFFVSTDVRTAVFSFDMRRNVRQKYSSKPYMARKDKIQ
jgi:hypothetical protein